MTDKLQKYVPYQVSVIIITALFRHCCHRLPFFQNINIYIETEFGDFFFEGSLEERNSHTSNIYCSGIMLLSQR